MPVSLDHLPCRFAEFCEGHGEAECFLHASNASVAALRMMDVALGEVKRVGGSFIAADGGVRPHAFLSVIAGLVVMGVENLALKIAERDADTTERGEAIYRDIWREFIWRLLSLVPDIVHTRSAHDDAVTKILTDMPGDRMPQA